MEMKCFKGSRENMKNIFSLFHFLLFFFFLSIIIIIENDSE